MVESIEILRLKAALDLQGQDHFKQALTAIEEKARRAEAAMQALGKSAKLGPITPEMAEGRRTLADIEADKRKADADEKVRRTQAAVARRQDIDAEKLSATFQKDLAREKASRAKQAAKEQKEGIDSAASAAKQAAMGLLKGLGLGAAQVVVAFEAIKKTLEAFYNLSRKSAEAISDVFVRLDRLDAVGAAGFMSKLIAPGTEGILTTVVGAFTRWENALVRINTLLEATGYRAGSSAGQLREMAEVMSRQTGFKLADVLSGQAELLKGGEIREDIFQKAMEKAKAIAVIKGISFAQAAAQVHEALMNPEAAQGLFKETGTPVDAGQLNRMRQIHAMWGMQPGAAEQYQGMVLNKLPNVNDSAFQTLSATVDKVAVKFNELFTKLGEQAVPVIENFIGLLNDFTPDIEKFFTILINEIDNTIKYYREHKGQLMELIRTVESFALGIVKLTQLVVVLANMIVHFVNWLARHSGGLVAPLAPFHLPDAGQRPGPGRKAAEQKKIPRGAPGARADRVQMRAPTFNFLSFEQSWRQVAQQIGQQSQLNMEKRKVELLQQAVGLLGQIAGKNPLGAAALAGNPRVQQAIGIVANLVPAIVAPIPFG